jgi:glutamate synthase (NADPH/NADH) small chain
VRAAVVVGGGNTAIDAAHELCGIGVPSVTMVYRRGENRMTGYAHELEAARHDGAVLMERAAVVEVLRSEGRACGVRVVETEDGLPTERERCVLPADLVVIAIGQAVLRDLAGLFPGVACDERGRIVADPNTGATGNPAVFAGGDARNGGREVVHAVAEGQRAARAIDDRLREAHRA